MSKEAVEKTCFAYEVTPATQNWKVKVLVLEKLNIQTYSNGTQLQKMLLMDEQGNEVKGLIWKFHIASLEQTLQPFSTYIVGAAHVQSAYTTYTQFTPKITMQWVLTKHSYIRPVTDKSEQIPYPSIEHICFSSLPDYAHSKEKINIIGAIIDIKDPKVKNTDKGLTELQEFTLINAELKPTTLTLWGDYVHIQGTELQKVRETKPIVLCKRIQVSTFGGLSLGTTYMSYIAIEPDIPEARILREWLNDNSIDVEINKIDVGQMSSQKPDQRLLDEPIIPLLQGAICAIKISVASVAQKICYTSCPKCSYTTQAQAIDFFYCLTCGTSVEGQARCRVNADISDSSGSVKATFFDNSAEDLIHRTSIELHGMNEEELKKTITQAEEWLHCREFIAQVKAVKKRYNDHIICYTVQQWKLKSDTPTCATAIDGFNALGGFNASEMQPTVSPPGTSTPIKNKSIQPTQGANSPSTETISPMKKLKLKGKED